MLNGKKVKQIDLPADFKLDVIGSDADKIDRAFSFSNYSNGNTFDGEVDELIVFREALEEDAMTRLLPVSQAPSTP